MIRLHLAAVTHRGCVREDNEDTIGVGQLLCHTREGTPFEFVATGSDTVACLVADGLGGHADGARASRLAAATLVDRWSQQGSHDEFPLAVIEADLVLGDEAKLVPGASDMGTTLVALVVHAGEVSCINVGDSPCFRVVDGLLIAVSVEDSPLTPQGVPRPEHVTAVTQTLGGYGSRPSPLPHVHRSLARPGDRYLLCSDGLTDVVSMSHLEQLLTAGTTPLGVVEAMLDAAIVAGGPDNISIVLATVVDPGR